VDLFQTSLYAIFLLGMKLGFTVETQKVNESRCSGDMLRLIHQGNLKHSHQLATIFWDSKGMLLINYLPPKTTSGGYYVNLLLKLRHADNKKQHGILTRMWLLDDNSPIHKTMVAQ